MTRRKPIQIACPQYQRLVRGEYDCDTAGSYHLGPGGAFLLERAHCGHLGGRCMRTLCVLHRHNRGTASSWFPKKIVPMPPARAARSRRGRDDRSAQDGSSLSIEA